MNKVIKQPDASHPIPIEPSTSHIVVTAGGKIVADTRASLTLREASYPPVHYIPRKDVDMAQLTRTDHSTYCPYKGDCSYYSIESSERGKNAVWTYETPYPAVAEIKDYVAFYPDRVDSIRIEN
ncbi:MAG: DUF427 domain-containing protein [Afipia sp.]|nr:DUF427 domain-containing protein [Afipia sp.]